MDQGTLNQYQTSANVTAIYPGRLGKKKKQTGKLLNYLVNTWAKFNVAVGGDGEEIKECLECGTPFIGLFYVTLGLSGEIGELQEKMAAREDFTSEDVNKEIGDVFWYLSQVCMELGVPFGYLLKVSTEYKSTRKIVNDPENIRCLLLITMSVWSGRIADIVKKLLRDSQGHLLPAKKEEIIENLAKILRAVFSVCAVEGLTPETAMNDNIDKLYSRMERGKLGGSGDNR